MNHVQRSAFNATDNCTTNRRDCDQWFTPKWVFDALGDFDLDPCTLTTRPFDTAKDHYCHDAGQNGLVLPWHGRVWLNPPYGKAVGVWMDLLARHGNGIALVFARTDALWAQSALRSANAVLFLQGRVDFLHHRRAGSRGHASTPSMLLAYGCENARLLARAKGVRMVNT